MEQAHLHLAQAGFSRGALRGDLQGFTDVAQQHVSALYFGGLAAVRLRNGFFYQALLQSDAQISGDDLDDVLGLERSELREQFADENCFGGRASSGCYFSKSCLYFLNR